MHTSTSGAFVLPTIIVPVVEANGSRRLWFRQKLQKENLSERQTERILWKNNLLWRSKTTWKI